MNMIWSTAHIHIHMYIYIYIFIYLFTRTHIYIYVCAYNYIYVYIHWVFVYNCIQINFCLGGRAADLGHVASHEVTPATEGVDPVSKPYRTGMNWGDFHIIPHLSYAYPLVNVYITMERSTHFQWENPLFLWSFSIAMWVITRGYCMFK